MRWFARRLGFYVFAIWVALTINFLLPRLMPGDPIGGLLQHLTPSQIQANPGIIDEFRTLLGGTDNSIWEDYVTYLGRIAHFDFGISTSNYPTPVSEVVGRTLPYSMFLVGVAFLLAFVLGIAIGMVAAWRRGRTVDNVVVPTFMALSALPAFFTALLRGVRDYCNGYHGGSWRPELLKLLVANGVSTNVETLDSIGAVGGQRAA